MSNRELKPEELELIDFIVRNDGVLPNSGGNKMVGFDFVYGDYFYLNKNKEKEQIQYCKDKESFKKLLQEQLSNNYIDIDNFLFNVISNKLKARRIVFNPHASEFYEEHGDRFFNTFTTNGSKLYLKKYIDDRIGVSLERHDISFLSKYPFISLLLKNVMNNNAEHVEYFINWLSTAVNTLDKNMTAIALIGSEEGTGKGVTEEFIIRPIFGTLMATMSNSELNSDFNHLLDEKMFIILNEIKADLKDSKMVAEKLKMMITDRNTAISRKFKDTVIKRNYYNIMLFSNEALPIKISETDRRWTVFNTSSIKLINIAEKLGFTMERFLDKIIEEREGFIFDLFLYKYNKQKAMRVLNTELKQNIAENTSTKIEVLCNKIKKMDLNWIIDKLEETINGGIKYEGFINSLQEEFKNGLISTNNICFLYRNLIDLEVLTDQKISAKFQQYLGKADVCRNGKRYRNLKKASTSLDDIKEEFIASFKTEKDIILENIKNFEEKKENIVNLETFLAILEKNEKDKYETKYIVFENEEKSISDETVLYFTNKEGNKYITSHTYFLKSEKEKTIVDKICKFKIPF